MFHFLLEYGEGQHIENTHWLDRLLHIRDHKNRLLLLGENNRFDHSYQMISHNKFVWLIKKDEKGRKREKKKKKKKKNKPLTRQADPLRSLQQIQGQH